MLCALIMAGGKGTRFWPLSTEEKPKQFLKLLGENTMIQMTVKRVEKLLPIERIFVVTAKQYVSLVKEQLPNLPDRNIIVEPVGKNTAPCIALSAFIIKKYYQDANIAVLPSDHLIKDEEKFIQVLADADKFIKEKPKAIVTIGMTPDRPETGYGYIKYSGNKIEVNSSQIISVEAFVEKPNLEKAKEYLSSGQYLWNGGMFIWKADNILNLTREYLNETYNILSEIAATKEEHFEENLEKKYNEVQGISVDYGIMENAKDIYVIPGDFGWDDVGNWSSIERYSKRDNNDNVKNGNSYFYNSSGNIVVTNKKVLLNNIDNLIIVETDDYILVSSKDREQEIKIAKDLIS
ncbi:mannose-1-phosphate guanylyltransferase [Clostridium sp. YIM B02515]|uniref:Mannose-1-phosphate guanylyltransferase n=1 Tax=Clostridium rhizosphaerae TaxID=2803861 RepID=A0ABS1TAG8_9CLOT|nr:mannose-1-phosphate guanylyltransferase [Clostridium rhizosphaerae]MBL4936343.1 mannose-1-phosphate guanylyltransferase [Clostridium rhizosphaerae]